MSQRIYQSELQQLAASFPLQSLSPKELALDSEPITRDPKPHLEVRAWVRFGPHAIDVEAVVHVWTDVALGICFTVDEKEFKCWIWKNAARPLRHDSDRQRSSS